MDQETYMDQETDPCHIAKMSGLGLGLGLDKCEPCIHVHCTQSQSRVSTNTTSKANMREYDSPEATASRRANSISALNKATKANKQAQKQAHKIINDKHNNLRRIKSKAVSDDTCFQSNDEIIFKTPKKTVTEVANDNRKRSTARNEERGPEQKRRKNIIESQRNKRNREAIDGFGQILRKDVQKFIDDSHDDKVSNYAQLTCKVRVFEPLHSQPHSDDLKEFNSKKKKDAKEMGKNIIDNCEFELCGICQKEDSKSKMVLRDSCEEKIKASNIQKLYQVMPYLILIIYALPNINL